MSNVHSSAVHVNDGLHVNRLCTQQFTVSKLAFSFTPSGVLRREEETVPRSYKQPVFPSNCQVFRAGDFPSGPVQYNGPAEKRLAPSAPDVLRVVSLVARAFPIVTIYLPKGVDVRDVFMFGGPDVIQWMGNPQWAYAVFFVDNAAAGFANEFRVCWCDPLAKPTPLPPG